VVTWERSGTKSWSKLNHLKREGIENAKVSWKFHLELFEMKTFKFVKTHKIGGTWEAYFQKKDQVSR